MSKSLKWCCCTGNRTQITDTVHKVYELNIQLSLLNYCIIYSFVLSLIWFKFLFCFMSWPDMLVIPISVSFEPMFKPWWWWWWWCERSPGHKGMPKLWGGVGQNRSSSNPTRFQPRTVSNPDLDSGCLAHIHLIQTIQSSMPMKRDERNE